MSEPERDARDPREIGGFADLSTWWTIEATGGDALAWLDDLVSADLRDLAPGRSRRSLLLSPTGAVLASFTVLMNGVGAMLVQDPAEPRSAGHLLERYVLSSDVQLRETTGNHAIFAFIEGAAAPQVPGAIVFSPSLLGAGVGVLAEARDRGALLSRYAASSRQLSDDEIEIWRIAAGIVRVGVDTTDGDLPEEAGLQGSVSFEKGCFLGQEAVAKVRNAGHPRRLVLPVESQDVLTAGEDVLADGRPVGAITSAARLSGRTLALARIGWDQRDTDLTSARGVVLERRG